MNREVDHFDCLMIVASLLCTHRFELLFGGFHGLSIASSCEAVHKLRFDVVDSVLMCLDVVRSHSLPDSTVVASVAWRRFGVWRVLDSNSDVDDLFL